MIAQYFYGTARFIERYNGAVFEEYGLAVRKRNCSEQMEESKYLLLHDVNRWTTCDTEIVTRLPTTFVLEYKNWTSRGANSSVAHNLLIGPYFRCSDQVWTKQWPTLVPWVIVSPDRSSVCAKPDTDIRHQQNAK